MTPLETVTRSLLDLLYALENANEGDVNDDFAVALMELTGAHLRDLTEDGLRILKQEIARIAETTADNKQKKFFVSILENLGIE